MLSLYIYRFLFPFRFLFRLRFLFLFLFPFLFRIPASGFRLPAFPDAQYQPISALNVTSLKWSWWLSQVLITKQRSFQNLLSFLVDNQVYNLFACILCPCLTSFPQWIWDMQTTVPGGGGTWVFFGWVCAARDSKLAPRPKKNFP